MRFRNKLKKYLSGYPRCVDPEQKRGRHFSGRSLSIVVPCYRHEAFIENCFASIRRQTVPPRRAIFVIDASPDDTQKKLEFCIAQAGKESPIEFVILENEENRGQAFSLNRSIAAADSELIMILNDDDYLLPDAVELAVRLINENPLVYLVGGLSIPFTDDSLIESQSQRILAQRPNGCLPVSLFVPDDVRYYDSPNSINITHSSCTFLKSAWAKAGGYFPNKNKRLVPYSDRDFQLRVNALFPIGIATIPLAFWRSDSSVDNFRNS